MRDEEDRPVAKATPLRLELEALSIHELEARIARLNDEISVCNELITVKKRQRDLADQLFSKRGD